MFELGSVKPHEFVEYGLGVLEKFAGLGDIGAKETRERLRIVVDLSYLLILHMKYLKMLASPFQNECKHQRLIIAI